MKHFRKILIANRGEIAARIMRTCRGMGIATAAIYSDPDRHAPFVRSADDAVYIGPPISSGSFLAIEKIVEAAHRVGADAVHPGYGFLAENADFAQACADAGLTFIGPSPEVIRRMGSKIEAKKLMVAAGVPVVPGFSAADLSDRDMAARARELGFPILVKASAGGGGKGMRIVREPGQLGAALASARREAKNAFGDDTLLLERYFDAPRHIEIQIFGDAHGNLIHCFERECSIQRRYQKIIEEAPSPALDAERRTRMAAAALTAGRALGYENAGTVEFIADQDGTFYFLEVNTRLQVEHPVTEAITGLDLVHLQILVAQGLPLPLRQADVAIDGHAIECRVYAENPFADFLPSTGTIACWEETPVPGVRYDGGVETGSEVTIYYDPVLAKVIAHAPTRNEAAQRLGTALAGLRIHGVQTNVPLLQAVLRHPEFLAGHLDTHFLGTHVPLSTTPSPAQLAADRVHAVAVALWLQAQRRAHAPVLRGIPSGWRNNPSQMQRIAFSSGEATISIRYRVHRDDPIDVVIGDEGGTAVDCTAAVLSCNDTEIGLVLDGIRRTCKVLSRGEVHYAHSVLGSSTLHEVPRFPAPQREEVHGGCLAPMPGKILAVRVTPGQVVQKGEPLVVLEAMKMEHDVTAPHDGVVREVRVEPGQQVDAGAVLVVLEEATASPE